MRREEINMSNAKLTFVRLVDREPENTDHCFNGGDYRMGRTIVVSNGTHPIAVRYWTSSDFDYCPRCDSFGHSDCGRRTAEPSEVEGWESGEEITEDERTDRLNREFRAGRFVPVSGVFK